MLALPPALAPLDAHRQFIIVRLTPHPTKPGKTEKFPIDWRDGSVSNAQDPEIWIDAKTACAMAPVWGADHCVGFVFTRDLGRWFMDIDGCLQPDGSWNAIAREMCAALPGAAIEVSQSGRGLHLFGRGLVPPHSSRRGEAQRNGLEFYTEGRFVALTGDRAVGNANADLTLEISKVVQRWFPPAETGTALALDAGPVPEWRGPTDDEDLIRRALQSKSAGSIFGGRASFADLWNGNVAALAGAYPTTGDSPYDRSSADAALAQHLAFWTGKDGARIERLMRQSALVREKWDDRPDYLGERTIGNAIRMQKDVLQDKAPAVLTADAAIRELMQGPQDQILQRWISLALPMPKGEAHALAEWVDNCTGHARGIRNLMKELGDAKQAADRLAGQEEIAKRAGDRRLIQHRPESCIEQTHEVEALIVAAARPGEFVQFGGRLSHVVTKPLPFTQHFNPDAADAPAVPQIEELDDVAALEQIEPRVAFFEELRNGRPKIVRVPEAIVKAMLGKKQHAAPLVNGLVTHPIVLPTGEILATDGLHVASGLFLSGAAVASVRPYTQSEAASALHRLREVAFAGTEFASALDADIAVSALLTGVERRLLDAAPGLAVLASVPASGKTTVARRIHIMLTGRDLPVTTFPLGDEAEVSKTLLALLRRNPAMVCFDNVPDGYTFRSGAMSAAMTTSTVEQRVLGVSRDASVPTNTLFVLTGNNLSLGVDEVSRWTVCRLTSSLVRPEERRFAHADVLKHALEHRDAILRDVAGIVAGYIAAHPGVRPGSGGSRFPAWDRVVRHPLIWAGGSDVAEVFRANSDQSVTVRARTMLLEGLAALHGEQEFFAKDVAMLPSRAAIGQSADAEALVWALESLGVKWSAGSVGSRLETLTGFKAESESGRVLELRARKTRTGVLAFRVVQGMQTITPFSPVQLGTKS